MIIKINDDIKIKQLLTKVVVKNGETFLLTEVALNKEIADKLRPYSVGWNTYKLPNNFKIEVEGD
jgi:hypothetical protein